MSSKVPPEVLVVDDDEGTRFVLSFALDACGYRVTVADDGADVPDLIQSHAFALLVIDLHMPGMNGFELLRQIRRGSAEVTPILRTRETVRILVVSGESHPASIANAKTLGADAYLCKPVDLGELERTVRKLLA